MQGIVMSIVKVFLLCSLLALGSCQNFGAKTLSSGLNHEQAAYCEENPAVCVLIGVAIVGGIVLATSGDSNSSPPAQFLD